MGAITEIFRVFSDEYRSRFPDMPEQHRKVINAIVHCRSDEFGVAVYQCDICRERRLIGCACGNRHCPQCQYHKSRQWLETQLARRLPGEHCMLTFTVPEQLRPFCRAHQQKAYAAMFKSSSRAIAKLARDPRLIGADLTPVGSRRIEPGGCRRAMPSIYRCGRSRRYFAPNSATR